MEAILDKRWDAKLKRSTYLVKYMARHSGSSSSSSSRLLESPHNPQQP